MLPDPNRTLQGYRKGRKTADGAFHPVFGPRRAQKITKSPPATASRSGVPRKKSAQNRKRTQFLEFQGQKSGGPFLSPPPPPPRGNPQTVTPGRPTLRGPKKKFIGGYHFWPKRGLYTPLDGRYHPSPSWVSQLRFYNYFLGPVGKLCILASSNQPAASKQASKQQTGQTYFSENRGSKFWISIAHNNHRAITHRLKQVLCAFELSSSFYGQYTARVGRNQPQATGNQPQNAETCNFLVLHPFLAKPSGNIKAKESNSASNATGFIQF